MVDDKSNKIEKEVISFLNGNDPMEHIIKIECGYNDDMVSIIYRDENNKKRIIKDDYYPFVWATYNACTKLYDGCMPDKPIFNAIAKEKGIGCKKLYSCTKTNKNERLKNGYRFIFYAKKPMTYSNFIKFFEDGGLPIYSKDNEINNTEKYYVSVAPNEQYMIYSGKRLFKGYDDYDDLKRMQFDLETTGLSPKENTITQIGIRTNRGFEKIIPVEGEGDEKMRNQHNAIDNFFKIIAEEDPDVISGYNSEDFDFNFIDVQLQKEDSSLKDRSSKFFKNPFYKKNKMTTLKLGGEVEFYKQTVKWGINITDGLIAVRRNQAIDSNMKKSTLKYATIYSELVKPNRVYVPGKIIEKTYSDIENKYAFNNENGEWYKITDEKPIKDNFIETTGRYIVQRYLLDDLWETDKVEARYNMTNFLVSKILPISFEKTCVTGTASLWKYIMLAWSYEHELAIPLETPSRKFTGGLSRLIKTGFIGEQVKLDYNSLYPSILLSWDIKSEVDIMNIMLIMLNYVLTEREKSKELKKKYGKIIKKLKEKYNENNDESLITEIRENESLQNKYDRDQTQKKVLGNSFFGAYGSGSSSGFYWSDVNSAEQVTCTGRQLLRLMISHFKNLGDKMGENGESDNDYSYDPIVGDSFVGDTPMFIKYNNNNLIDIKPISEMIDKNSIKIDYLKREYDYSKKEYKVLCRSGWIEPSYIYRHKTNKSIYEVYNKKDKMEIEVTEDHSLFDENQNKIKPFEINKYSKLEYYNEKDIFKDFNTLDIEKTWNVNNLEITIEILNATIEKKKDFYYTYMISSKINDFSKTYKAKIQFIENCINAYND